MIMCDCAYCEEKQCEIRINKKRDDGYRLKYLGLKDLNDEIIKELNTARKQLAHYEELLAISAIRERQTYDLLSLLKSDTEIKDKMIQYLSESDHFKV